MYILRYYHKTYIDNAMIFDKNTKKWELSKFDELLKSLKQAIDNLEGRNMDSIIDGIFKKIKKIL